MMISNGKNLDEVKKKKKKPAKEQAPAASDYAAEINAENRAAE